MGDDRKRFENITNLKTIRPDFDYDEERRKFYEDLPKMLDELGPTHYERREAMDGFQFVILPSVKGDGIKREDR